MSCSLLASVLKLYNPDPEYELLKLLMPGWFHDIYGGTYSPLVLLGDLIKKVYLQSFSLS